MNVTEFKRFAKIFVPYYEDLCKISGEMSYVGVKVNHIRGLLCREYPDECHMLTVSFIEWLREPLDELGIDILFDRKNSLRSGEIALSRTDLLDEQEERVIHYLMETEL